MASRFQLQASITVGGTTYRVQRYALREQLSAVSSVDCVITFAKQDDIHDESAPDPRTLIDQPAILTIQTLTGSEKRTFVGSVVRAERTDRLVRLTIEPDAWRLSRRADCRTFQQMTAVDIVKQVLTDAGVGSTQWKTTGTYPTRDYTVQYRETDLAFAQRLLSEEGIYFAIQHGDSTDTIVFGDDPTGFGPVAGPASLSFRTDLDVGDDVGGFALVTDVQRSQRARSDKTTLRDYDSTKPKVKLESTAKTAKASAEVYVWPGRFTDESVGHRLAQVLLDSLRADGDVITGHATVLTLVPGARFSIEGHPLASLNQEYLVVGVEIHGFDERFGGSDPADAARALGVDECRFRAIPTKTSPYRPPRVVRERFVTGAQTALTTGPAGQEIYTDAGGHVKAQFYWDRLGQNDDKSSLWMRTSQLPTGGSMLLPRMKWEVAVRYLEGDVDRPYVMARMVNAATPPPYDLPANKGRSSVQTATTPGGGSTNEIRMTDDAGNEEMFMNASKDMSIDVGNNTTESIQVNLTRQIGSNHALNITDSLSASVGGNQTVKVGGQQAINVQTFLVDQIGGNQSLSIGAARSMKIGGDHKRDVTGDSTLSVGATSIDLVVGAANEHGLADSKQTVGAALVEMTAGGRSLIVGGNRSETATLAKVIVTQAGRSVGVSGSLSSKVAGLVYRKVDGDLAEKASANITEVATGAQILKATNIGVEAETMLTIAMGASVIVLMPSMVTIAGVSLKVDGEVVDEGALVLDN